MPHPLRQVRRKIMAEKTTSAENEEAKAKKPAANVSKAVEGAAADAKNLAAKSADATNKVTAKAKSPSGATKADLKPKIAATKTAKATSAAKPKEKSAHGKTVTIKQIGSPIGRHHVQRQTLIGLGLNKLNRVRTLEDTPAVRGMINKMRHLVAIID